MNPGNLMDRGPDEYYTSAPFELPEGSQVTSISWEAVIPAKTWVKAQLRYAGAREDLEAARWDGPDGEGSWYDKGQWRQARERKCRWVQYRLALGATNSLSTPRVTRVDIHPVRP